MFGVPFSSVLQQLLDPALLPIASWQKTDILCLEMADGPKH